MTDGEVFQGVLGVFLCVLFVIFVNEERLVAELAREAKWFVSPATVILWHSDHY